MFFVYDALGRRFALIEIVIFLQWYWLHRKEELFPVSLRFSLILDSIGKFFHKIWSADPSEGGVSMERYNPPHPNP